MKGRVMKKRTFAILLLLAILYTDLHMKRKRRIALEAGRRA